MRDHRVVARVALAVLVLALLFDCRPEYPEVLRAVYRINILYEIEGVDGSRSFLPGLGTAVAVSSDGDLLTARHVVDFAEDFMPACYGYLVGVRVAVVRILVRGPDGRSWAGRAVPPYGLPCDRRGRLRLIWDASSQAIVRAVDWNVDLALVHVNTASIPHLILQRTAPRAVTPMVGMGFGGAFGSNILRVGTVVQSCTLRGEPIQPMLEVSQTLKPGMSGGPIAHGVQLFGIAVRVQVAPPYHTFAVPSTYAAAWYDWVRGDAVQPPPIACP